MSRELGEGITPEAIQAKALNRRCQPLKAPKYFPSLQGALVLAKAKGRKVHSAKQNDSTKRPGVVNYSGRQLQTLYFNFVFDDESSELLTRPLLRSRIAANSKQAQAAQAMTTSPPVYKPASMHNPNVSDVHAHFHRAMPSEHKRLKLEAVVRAARNSQLHNGAVTEPELEDLRGAVGDDFGTMFL